MLEPVGDLEDGDLDMGDSEQATRRKASLDALKLYSGSFASCETPMSRFTTVSPAHDTHPWLAKHVMEESGIASGDLEALEIRKLASDMAAYVEPLEDDSQEASLGSPHASSDTLSVSKFMGARTRRRKEGRTWRKTDDRMENVRDTTVVARSARRPMNAGEPVLSSILSRMKGQADEPQR